MPGRRPRPLPPSVRDLVAADRQGAGPRGPLAPDAVEDLVAVARGEEDFDTPVSPARALRLLPQHAPPDVAVRVLEDAAFARDRPLRERVTAVQTLGDVDTDSAQRGLLRAARIDDPPLQLAAFEALGRGGGAAVAAELADLPEPRDDAARRQLALARALVAHREGVEGVTVPDVRPSSGPLPDRERAALDLRVKPERDTARDLRRLRGTTWGMEVASRALSLRCGPTAWEILLNRRLRLSGVVPTALLDRPWVAAVLAQWTPTGERLTTRYVVLSRPGDRGRAGEGLAQLDVVRADGTPAYAGTARLDGRALDLEIADVARAGTAPARLSARLSSDGVAVRDASAVATRVDVRATTSVEVP